MTMTDHENRRFDFFIDRFTKGETIADLTAAEKAEYDRLADKWESIYIPRPRENFGF